MSNTVGEMPKYKCHKEVWALQIAAIEILEGFARIHFKDEKYSPIQVTKGYVHKHNPQPDGYYVVYKDGYKSYSPKEAFEEGYHAITVDKNSNRPIIPKNMTETQYEQGKKRCTCGIYIPYCPSGFTFATMQIGDCVNCYRKRQNSSFLKNAKKSLKLAMPKFK